MAQEFNLVERRICFLKDLIFAHLCQHPEYVHIRKCKPSESMFAESILVCGVKGNDQLNALRCDRVSIAKQYLEQRDRHEQKRKKCRSIRMYVTGLFQNTLKTAQSIDDK